MAVVVSQLAVSTSSVSVEVDSVSLDAESGTTLALGRGSYDGILDITSFPAGLAAVEETTLDRYLFGITEVPSSWPDDALAAQAVAARTYLAWTLHRGRSINGTKYNYDICASQACQVYRGPGDAAQSWAAAVTRTSGEILVYENAPAQALYSASAGSRTRYVQDIWGGSGLPYLVAVDSPEAGFTPYERWELEVTAEQFARVFAKSGYNFGDRIDDVAVVGPGEGNGPEHIEVRSELGVTSIPATQFRASFNVHGPDLFPGLMPAARPNGGRWPQTILSYTFTVDYQAPQPVFHPLLPPGETGATGVLTVIGEGWGHAVGMSQWGAMAMASNGTSYDSILDHYYGLKPERADAMLPDTVRVGLFVEESWITVTADGPFALEAPGFDPIRLFAGEYTFWWTGDGVIVVAPSGVRERTPLFYPPRLQPQ